MHETHIRRSYKESSRSCYDNMFGDELSGYGNTYPVFKSVEEAEAYDGGENEFEAYFPAEPCPCMVRREKELAMIKEYRKANPVSCDDDGKASWRGNGCLRPECWPKYEWSDNPRDHRKCDSRTCRVWQKRDKLLEVRHQCGSDCDSLDFD